MHEDSSYLYVSNAIEIIKKRKNKGKKEKEGHIY